MRKCEEMDSWKERLGLDRRGERQTEEEEGRRRRKETTWLIFVPVFVSSEKLLQRYI